MARADDDKRYEDMLRDPALADIMAEITRDAGGASAASPAETPEEDKDFIDLEVDKDGNPVRVIENFIRVMHNDPWYKGVRYNLLTLAPEKLHGGRPEKWTDADNAASMHYIENRYGIYHRDKHDQALRILWEERGYHPVRELVDTLVWDGTPRIEAFLTVWMKAADEAYSREVSRLIFAGGVHRLYHPGSKFDLMPVLIGTEQGEGKSTLVEWLAMDEAYYGEVTDIENPKGIEQLSGVWIAEMGELLALTRARELEAIKAYLTRLKDRYRAPYNRFLSERPRQCIFIGTTNNRQFLVDKTGNRRFLPILIHSGAKDLFAHEEEIRAYIRQCWAEAKSRMDAGLLSPYEDYDLTGVIRAAQDSAMVDDWRDGRIRAYLELLPVGTKCCVQELRQKALYPGDERLKEDKAESRQLSILLGKIPGWKECGAKTRPTNARDLGTQRCWEKLATFVSVDESDIFAC